MIDIPLYYNHYKRWTSHTFRATIRAMIRAMTLMTLLCLLIFLLLPPALAAAPQRMALVVANSSYSFMKPLPACLASVNKMTASLRQLDFQVFEHLDQSSGALSGKLDSFLRKLKASSGASGFIYFCGYGAEHNNRLFLLPASANISHPSNILTQGVLVKSLVDLFAHGGTSRAIVALDLMAHDKLSTTTFDNLSSLSREKGTGLITVSGILTNENASPLSQALADTLTNPAVKTATLLSKVEQTVATSSSEIGILLSPSHSLALVEKEPAVSALASPLAANPMDKQQLRLVQIELAKRGFYSDRIDGVFGSHTRQAIRNFQLSIDAEATGKMTSQQMGMLITSSKKKGTD